MQRSKPDTEKNVEQEKGRQRQGGNDERKKDDLTRQQQQDDTSPRQPGKDPDVLEDNEGTDVETDSNSRRPKVQYEPR
jgi:hypothetical protein